jgi:hypothetical protein
MLHQIKEELWFDWPFRHKNQSSAGDCGYNFVRPRFSPLPIPEQAAVRAVAADGAQLGLALISWRVQSVVQCLLFQHRYFRGCLARGVPKQQSGGIQQLF